MKKSEPKGIIFLLIAAIVWGGAFAVQCIAAEKITPLFFNASRFLIGAVSLIPLILIFEKGANDKKMLKHTVIIGIIAGLLLCSASYIQQVGIGLTDSAGKAGFITGLYMLFVPFIGLFLGNRTALNSWLGALLGIGGLFFICMNGSGMTVTKGDALLISCAVIFALHIVIIDRFGGKMYSLRFSAVQFLTSAIISFIGALFTEEIGIEPIKASIIPILYCGIFSVGIGYTFQTLGQKYSEPTSASILLSTESVFSAVFGAIILHERMEPLAYVGCVLIFAGIVISQLNFKKKKKSL